MNAIDAVTIGKLIAAHREGDEKKFKNYVDFIAEAYEQQGNNRAANIIRNNYTGDFVKHKISEIGAQMLRYQEQLAREYKYKPIPRTFFCDVRAEFQKALPEWCNVSGDTISLETADGTVITNGYNRIVIGDYGAFVEFSRVQACMRRLEIKEGQMYRAKDPRYAEHVKYLWLTADDGSDVKVYDQKRPVEYADYKPGMLYVSVYEVFPTEVNC